MVAPLGVGRACPAGGSRPARRPIPGWLAVTVLSAAVFVIAPHQLAQSLPHPGVDWTVRQQVFGSTYVWFTALLLTALWWRWRARDAR